MKSKRSASQFALRVGEVDVPDVSNELKFWLLLVFAIFSLVCSLFVIHHHLFNRKVRQGLHNHCILLLTIANVLLIFTDVLWNLISLRRAGHSPISTPAFCVFWWFLDDTLYNVQTSVLAWASIERHILIFNSKLFRTSRQKLLYHYLPPAVLIVYLISFHASVLIFPPCSHTFDFTDIQCGSNPCYVGVNVLTIWDTIVNNATPTLVIAVVNIALLCRVIAHKKRMRRPIQWRKHRRMAVQLLTLSAVYCFLNLPMIIITFIQLILTRDPRVDYGSQLYIFVVTYSVTLSLPFVAFFNGISFDRQRHLRVSPTDTFVPRQISPGQRNVSVKPISSGV